MARPFIVLNNKRIIELYGKGLPARNIGLQFHVSQTPILRILKEHNILIKHFTKPRIYTIDEDCFSRPLNENIAYWVGFLMADGSISKRDYRVYVGLASIDKEHLLKFASFLGTNKPLYFREKTEQFCLDISSKKIKEKLAEFGVINNKSLIATMQNINQANERHFWRGVLDGDGCIRKDNVGNWRVILCGSNNICNQFLSFVKQNGIHTHAKVRKMKNVNCHLIGITGNNQVSVLLSLLYKNNCIALDRKNILAQKMLEEK